MVTKNRHKERRRRARCPVCDTRIVRISGICQTSGIAYLQENCKTCGYCYINESGGCEETMGLVTLQRNWVLDDRDIKASKLEIAIREHCLQEARKLWTHRTARTTFQAMTFANASVANLWRRLYGILENEATVFPMNWQAAQLFGADRFDDIDAG